MSDKIGDVYKNTDLKNSVLSLPETDDIQELLNSAKPFFVRHALNLAAMSNRLPDVVKTLETIFDRTDGKPAQSVQLTGKNGGEIQSKMVVEFVHKNPDTE